jgi:hypothetical protein
MIGEYEHSIFMYNYKLTLIDSDSYKIEESSDQGSGETIGTWTLVGRQIWLTPKKGITIDVYRKQTEIDITSARIETVEVETDKLLVPKLKHFKLERTK